MNLKAAYMCLLIAGITHGFRLNSIQPAPTCPVFRCIPVSCNNTVIPKYTIGGVECDGCPECPEECPLFQCATPLCSESDYIIPTVVVNGVECDGCPECPQECPSFKCPAPTCSDYVIEKLIINGRECDGCSICPPDNHCANLPRCSSNDCTWFQGFCSGSTPTCEYEEGAFCRGCNHCPTCDDIQCPEPPANCQRFETIKLERRLFCEGCQVCIDEYSICPEIDCRFETLSCNHRQIPLWLSGKVCLDCPYCITSSPPCGPNACPDCVRDDSWNAPLDERGCPTRCPPCKHESGGNNNNNGPSNGPKGPNGNGHFSI